MEDAIVLIDGENICAKNEPKIKAQLELLDFFIIEIRVYHLQKQASTIEWTKIANNNDNYKDIRLFGEPSKNKVDKKLIKDAKSILKKLNKDIIVISSDGGYSILKTEAEKLGKKTWFMGDEKASKKIRKFETYIPLN